MRTKKPNKTLAQTHVASGDSTSEIPLGSPVGPDSQETKPDRISFNITDAGAPDWNRMLPKTKDQLTKVLQNKAVQKELGITEETAKEIAKTEIGEDEANALLSLISGINATGASMVYKIPSEITSRAFEFTADHRKKINPSLIKVLNKWAPAMFKTWKDEFGLGIVLVSTVNAQIRLMHMLEEQRKKQEGRQPAREKVTPIAPPKSEPAPEPVAPPPAAIAPPDLLDGVGLNL